MTIIFDIEASCDKDNKSYPMETIEIGAVKIVEGEVMDKFQTFIKPEYVSSLTEFCTSLTGITYEMLENAPSFKEGISAFYEFALGHKIYSCGQFDRKFLTREIQDKIPETSFLIIKNFIESSHINLKDLYSNVTGFKQAGMINMASRLNLEIKGSVHRALDDAVNLSNIYLELDKIRKDKIDSAFGKRRTLEILSKLQNDFPEQDFSKVKLSEIADEWEPILILPLSDGTHYLKENERTVISKMTKYC